MDGLTPCGEAEDVVYKNQVITDYLLIDGACSVTIKNCYILSPVDQNAIDIINTVRKITMTNNIIVNTNSGCDAVGIMFANEVEIKNNTIISAGYRDISILWCGSTVINNNILVGTGTAEDQMGAIWFWDPGVYDFSYNCFYGWIDGNIKNADNWPYFYLDDPVGTVNAYPIFASSAIYTGIFPNGYFLSQIAAGQSVNSPCVDTGIGVTGAGALLGTTRTDLVLDY